MKALKKVKMYRVKCTECNKLSVQTPTEKDARKRRRKHVKNTGHIVKLKGVYDSPKQPCFVGPDGAITGEEKHALEQKIKAKAEAEASNTNPRYHES